MMMVFFFLLIFGYIFSLWWFLLFGVLVFFLSCSNLFIFFILCSLDRLIFFFVIWKNSFVCECILKKCFSMVIFFGVNWILCCFSLCFSSFFLLRVMDFCFLLSEDLIFCFVCVDDMSCSYLLCGFCFGEVMIFIWLLFCNW